MDVVRDILALGEALGLAHRACIHNIRLINLSSLFLISRIVPGIAMGPASCDKSNGLIKGSRFGIHKKSVFSASHSEAITVYLMVRPMTAFRRGHFSRMFSSDGLFLGCRMGRFVQLSTRLDLSIGYGL